MSTKALGTVHVFPRTQRKSGRQIKDGSKDGLDLPACRDGGRKVVEGLPAALGLMLSHVAGRTGWIKTAALLLLLAKCTSALQSVGLGSRVPSTHKAWTRQASLLAAPCREKPADRLALRDGGATLLPSDARPHRNIATLRLRGGGARGCIATFQVAERRAHVDPTVEHAAGN